MCICVCVCIWCLSFVSILQESSFNALVTGCDLVAIISSHQPYLTWCLPNILSLFLSLFFVSPFRSQCTVHLFFLSFIGLQSVVSQPMFLVASGKKESEHSMPSEMNEFTKNIAFLSIKHAKDEIEFQISLNVLIIQEPRKKIVCAPSCFDI